MLAVMEIKPFAMRAEVRNTGLTTPASR
jgi:hypothetical protein